MATWSNLNTDGEKMNTIFYGGSLECGMGHPISRNVCPTVRSHAAGKPLCLPYRNATLGEEDLQNGNDSR